MNRNASLPAVAMVLAACTFPALAEEAAKAPGKPAISVDTGILDKDERKFRELSRDYFRFVYPVRDNFVVVHPTYAATIANTRGLTRQSIAEQLTDSVDVVTTAGGVTIREKKKVPPNRDDVLAACALRSMAVGEFGDVASVRVREILGRDEALVEEIGLYDRNSPSIWSTQRDGRENQKVGRLWREVRDNQERLRRTDDAGYWNPGGGGRICRLVGYATATMREGEPWGGPGGKGLRVVVGWTDRAKVTLNGNPRDIPVPVLVATDKLSKAVDAKGFDEFLEKRKFVKADFLAVHKAASEENNGNSAKVKAAVLWDLALLGAKDKRPAQEVAPERPPVAGNGNHGNNGNGKPAHGGGNNGGNAPRPDAPPAVATPVKPAPAPAPAPEAPVVVGRPIFSVDDRPAAPKPAQPVKPATPVASAPPAAPVAPPAPKYVVVPPNAQVDALVDLKNREVLVKLVVGRWQSADPAKAPFYRVCAADGTYQEFDAADAPTGGGEYRVTAKGVVAFIGKGSDDLLQFSFRSPNELADGGLAYRRVVPGQ